MRTKIILGIRRLRAHGQESGRSLRLRECLVFVWCLFLSINSLMLVYRDIDGDGWPSGPQHYRPIRTKEYALFVDRVGDSLGWSECLADNERICESVNASGLSRPAVLDYFLR